MSYGFDKLTDRRGWGSLKWDVPERELPMWVADMDFPTAPEVAAAISDRAAHGIFGYSVIPDEWYDAYIGWWKNRHGLVMNKDELIFCSGVIPAISSIIRRITCPAENVAILTPVYNIFYNCILNNGRRVLECPLTYKNGGYSIDLDELEKALALPQTTLLLMSNPHNPVGKIWERDTLMKIGELCEKYGVTVLSDEIHCDLTDPDKEYLPFASVSDDCRNISITCISPTKAFNLAGIQTSAVFISNKALYDRICRGFNNDEIAEPNAFAVQAAVAAFTKGEKWLDSLRDYLYENKKLTDAFVREELSGVRLVPSEATYLLWLDCTSICAKFGGGLAAFIREKTGLYLSAGEGYGKGGEGFLRLNIACPRVMLKDGLERLKKGIQAAQDSRL